MTGWRDFGLYGFHHIMAAVYMAYFRCRRHSLVKRYCYLNLYGVNVIVYIGKSMADVAPGSERYRGTYARA